MGITKQGPFRVPKLSENYPQYGRLLAREAEKLVALPDFSDDRRLFILSDFGCEHNGADYATYSSYSCVQYPSADGAGKTVMDSINSKAAIKCIFHEIRMKRYKLII